MIWCVVGLNACRARSSSHPSPRLLGVGPHARLGDPMDEFGVGGRRGTQANVAIFRHQRPGSASTLGVAGNVVLETTTVGANAASTSHFNSRARPRKRSSV